MSKRWRQGMAAAHEADTSWSIKWAVKAEDGSLKRWRRHFNASLQRQGTPAEHQAQRTLARDQARDKARELTQDPNVVWVTVYPPFKYALFRTAVSPARLAPISRWTRSKGWVTDTEDKWK